MNWASDTCDHYWEHADWLPPWYILDRWCQSDDRCRQAIYAALLSACERGDVKYGRRDGKRFDDPVHELAERRILIIERASFDAWAIRLDGTSPLAGLPRPMQPLPSRPAWATPMPAVTVSTPNPPVEVPPSEAAVEQGDVLMPVAAASPTLAPPLGDVPSGEIIAAFPVVADEKENTEWWKVRMREAKDYGLTSARTHVGRLRDQSRWQPHLIAAWLVDKGHMKAKLVKRILLRSFPDWADAADYFGDD